MPYQHAHRTVSAFLPVSHMLTLWRIYQKSVRPGLHELHSSGLFDFPPGQQLSESECQSNSDEYDGHRLGIGVVLFQTLSKYSESKAGFPANSACFLLTIVNYIITEAPIYPWLALA